MSKKKPRPHNIKNGSVVYYVTVVAPNHIFYTKMIVLDRPRFTRMRNKSLSVKCVSYNGVVSKHSLRDCNALGNHSIHNYNHHRLFFSEKKAVAYINHVRHMAEIKRIGLYKRVTKRFRGFFGSIGNRRF